LTKSVIDAVTVMIGSHTVRGIEVRDLTDMDGPRGPAPQKRTLMRQTAVRQSPKGSATIGKPAWQRHYCHPIDRQIPIMISIEIVNVIGIVTGTGNVIATGKGIVREIVNVTGNGTVIVTATVIETGTEMKIDHNAPAARMALVTMTVNAATAKRSENGSTAGVQRIGMPTN
jgi:hypothetical protein